MGNDGKRPGRERPANDNRPPDGQDAGHDVDAAERLDKVVLSIARLIGRQIAREHFEALRAANDNNRPSLGQASRKIVPATMTTNSSRGSVFRLKDGSESAI